MPALSDGYACFKLKVGLPDDVERVAAVREAIGPWPALRVDANGAWSVDEAVQAIRSIEGNDLELVEQPCRTLRELAEVRQRVSTADRRRRVGLLAARAAPRRGARGVRRREREGGRRRRLQVRRASCCARRAPPESDVFLSSTLDGPWGIAAVAAARRGGGADARLRPGDAAELFDSPLARALPPPRAGTLGPCRRAPGSEWASTRGPTSRVRHRSERLCIQ